MTALTADRDTPIRASHKYRYPMASAAEIFRGSLVVLDTAGNAEPATDAASKIAVGRSNEYVNNTGAAAAKSVEVEAGEFKWVNSGTNTLDKTDIGNTVYIVDDQTVDSSATTSSAAGIMTQIDDDGDVWVETKPPMVLVLGLLAANNLSDVGSASTSADNLALGTGDAVAHLDLTLAGDLVVDLTSTLTGAVACGAALSAVGAITGLSKFSTQTAAYTVVNGDGDEVIEDLTDNAVITLPNCAAGNKGQKVTVVDLAASAAAKISISPDASDKIVGSIMAIELTGAADKDIILTKATSIQGDHATLVSDGVDTWFIIGGQGVWEAE